MAEMEIGTWLAIYNFAGVEVTDDQLWEVERIVDRFHQELLDDSGDAIVEFHFGCNHDRIEWDDQDFSHMEIAPRITISLDFEELGGGRFNAVTPEGIAQLMFEGRNRKQFREEMLTALILERDRVAHGWDSELHLKSIQKHMNKARGAVLTSFRAAKWGSQVDERSDSAGVQAV